MTAPMIPYRAVLIQYVHSAPWKERLNLGAALECADGSFADARFVHSVTRVSQAFEADARMLRERIGKLEAALRVSKPGELLSTLSMLLPPNFDAGLVVSAEIRGITDDPAATLASFVERFEPKEHARSRNDQDIWREFRTLLGGTEKLMQPREAAGLVPHTFKHVWRNGVLNAVETVSLDLHAKIRERAAESAGLYRTLAADNSDLKIALVVGTPRGADQRDDSEAALTILRGQLPSSVELVPEKDAPALAERIKREAHEFEPA